jgi:iron complex transport system permease protein
VNLTSSAQSLDLMARAPLWLQYRARAHRRLLVLGALLVVVLGVSLFLGRYPQVGFLTPAQILEDPLAQRLILNLRLPRLLAAVMIGMSLAGAGLVLQMVFSNPLVEPGFLGVSQAAAFGAALSIILFGGAAWRVQASAVFFGLGGLALSYLLARRVRYGGWVLRLLLSGIAVSALFASGVGLIKYLADPLRQLPEITFWLLGGLAGVTWKPLLAALPLMVLGLVILILMRWRLNLLALEDEVAFSLGVAVHRERLLVLLAAVMVTAASISIGGLIGWVGLLVPQLARRLSGADARYAVPTALLLGGTFVVLCDDLARVLSAGEIPLGVLTSLLGAVGFLLLMTRPAVKV